MAKVAQAIGLTPKLPKISAPVKAPQMPDPNSQQAKVAARKRAEEGKKKREGRSDSIRGGLYANANLGGTA